VVVVSVKVIVYVSVVHGEPVQDVLITEAIPLPVAQVSQVSPVSQVSH